MSNIILYVDKTLTSPYAMSVYVTLLEKHLPFSIDMVDLDAGANLVPPYRDLGLTGRVPTLVHGDFVLSESTAITEYLDERFPAPEFAFVLPRDLRQRAQARQIQAWLRSDLMPLRSERSTDVIFVDPVARSLTPEGEASARRLIRIAERLIDGANLFGDWCIADTDLALMLNRLIKNGDPVPQKLKDYADAQWQRESVQKWVSLPRTT